MNDITRAMNDITTRQQLISSGAERVIICLDTSASMSSYFGRQSRIQTAKIAVKTILASSIPKRTAYGLIIFNTEARLVSEITSYYDSVSAKVSGLEPYGTTMYTLALKTAYQQSPQRVILVSDGEPAETEHEIMETLVPGIPVDTIAVADSIQILKKISEYTGGIYQMANTGDKLIESMRKLETNARLMLTHR